jgi:hypothetical protein
VKNLKDSIKMKALEVVSKIYLMPCAVEAQRLRALVWCAVYENVGSSVISAVMEAVRRDKYRN